MWTARLSSRAATIALGTALTVLGAAPATAASSCRVELWVSPGGSDAAKGDRWHPFRTLQRARDAVRDDARRGRCDFYVTLRGGTYRLDAPLVLDARDSGAPGHDVVYRAAKDELVVISGAVRIEGWQLHDSARGIHRAQVGDHRSRQLYVNGVRATRAGADYPADYSRTETGYRFSKPDAPPPAWSNPTDLEAHTIAQWKIMSCPVASVSGPELVMQPTCWRNAALFPSPWNFQLLARLENAYELLDEPGEWYLDSSTGWLYYEPRPGEDLRTADVELPVLDALIDGRGELGAPVTNLRFERLVFAYATWMQPSGPDGYVADQSGFHVVGDGHEPNEYGHQENTVRTPGNVRFRYAREIELLGNAFVHLGAVGLDFDTGSQHVAIVDNRFEDISSAAIQVGGVVSDDHHPSFPEQVTRDNRVSNNLIRRVGVEYLDAAAIYLGFSTRTTIDHNDISQVPWSGIAMGWGWGLLDPGSFPGVPHAESGAWGTYDTPTPNRGNRVVYNRIHAFAQSLWDAGAIYNNGAQGTSEDDGALLAGNVAFGKRRDAGTNVFYTDGGSRYMTLFENVSYDDPQGVTDFGPCGLPTSLALCSIHIPYGSSSGGCRPYGDLVFASNYWDSNEFYVSACPFPPYPVDVARVDNRVVRGPAEVPSRILREAGRQARPVRSGLPRLAEI